MLPTKKTFCLLLILLISCCWQTTTASAQRRRANDKSNSTVITLRTKDGVKLKATYYPSALGKEAVPIVMLHDFKESRAVFDRLADALQNPPSSSNRPSHAIITVDLRGHGESTKQEGSNGRTRELEAARLGKNDFLNMVEFDMEAVRKFLVKKNDAGELNLNKLCILGSGMGANVATWAAAKDWNTPKLASRKQGQDVKGLILCSPEWGYRGLPLLKPLKQPGVQREISMLVIYGKEDRKAAKSAKTIQKNLKKYHPAPEPGAEPEEQELLFIDRPTSLQGTRLLMDREFRILPIIDFFVEARLSNQDFEWVQRRRSN